MTLTYTFNKTTPLAGGPTYEGDDEIRAVKLAVQERENKDHYWEYSGNTVDADTIGQHRQITFHSQITTPTTVAADKGMLYIYDASAGHAELYWMDENEAAVRLTNSGKLYLGANVDYTEEVQLTNTGNSFYGDLIVCTADGRFCLPKGEEASFDTTEGNVFYETDGDVVKFRTASAWRTLVSTATMAISNIKLGSYEGDGNATQAITGVGFEPSLLLILPGTSYNSFLKTSDMGTTEAKCLATDSPSTSTNDSIRSLDADGFTVGNGTSLANDNMNNSGDTYYYIALKVVA